MKTEFTRAEMLEHLFLDEGHILFNPTGDMYRVLNGQLEARSCKGSNWYRIGLPRDCLYYLTDPTIPKAPELPDELKAESLRNLFFGLETHGKISEEFARRILDHIHANYERKK